MNFDELIQKELMKNPELKKVFDVDPKKKELYKQKLVDSWDQTWGCAKINPKYCKTCMFRHGDSPFADNYKKAYCMIYRKENGISKPKSVYFEGKLCEYYAEETEEDAE